MVRVASRNECVTGKIRKVCASVPKGEEEEEEEEGEEEKGKATLGRWCGDDTPSSPDRCTRANATRHDDTVTVAVARRLAPASRRPAMLTVEFRSRGI